MFYFYYMTICHVGDQKRGNCSDRSLEEKDRRPCHYLFPGIFLAVAMTREGVLLSFDRWHLRMLTVLQGVEVGI